MSETLNWEAPTSDGFSATVVLPGSKSLTNRELVLSALADEPSRLIAPLISRDSNLMIEALTSLGVKFEWEKQNLLVTPGVLTGPAKIDCGLAGTVMRFLPPLSMLATGDIEFDGDAGARARPMQTTIDSLQALGALVTAESASLPFTVHATGAVAGGELQIDASSSSQFVSGLLLSAARFANGLNLTHVGRHLPSMPHIEMTIATLLNRGINASSPNPANWVVEPGVIGGGEVVIEPDLSNAGPFLAAAMVAAGEVSIPNWPEQTTQVGSHYINILRQMGATVELVDGTLTVSGNGEIQGVDLDLSEAGELTPTIAGLCALATSPSRLTGIRHLRGHETDRLAALATEINKLGGKVTELEDGLVIEPAALKAGVWHSYHDHRMATTGAIIGLRVPGVEVEDIQTTSKTMPDFPEMWRNMLESK